MGIMPDWRNLSKSQVLVGDPQNIYPNKQIIVDHDNPLQEFLNP